MSPSKFAVVETEYGPVKGARKATALGRDYFNFTSIPYMKAPVGKLRFRDAEAPERWTEPMDVSGERPSYLYYNAFTLESVGQEDAGIVSVFTPYLDRALPVAVYIHGGGFQMSYPAQAWDILGCDYLLQKDILLVTINYRVGPFGFLSLRDPDLSIPGNAGLKDQVAALKWVQRNIANFGGDPDNVTVFGTSAGGTSIHLLMLSELSKGLFKRAIPMSGTAFIKTWPFAAKKDLTERLAKAVGWDGSGGERKILEVLENADGKELVKAEAGLLTSEEKIIEHILFPFTPCIEPYVKANSFISKDPMLMSRDAWSNGIDCMLGGTSLEGGLMSLFAGNCHEFFKHSDALTPLRVLGLDPEKPSDKRKISEIGKKLQKFYFGENLPSAETRQQYFLYAGDLHFSHGVFRAALSRAEPHVTGKTYFYRFNAQTSINMGKVLFQAESEGACHGDDIGYLFYSNTAALKAPGISSIEFELIKKMISLVTSFVIDGNPTSFESEVTWDPITSTKPFECLNISNDSTSVIPLPEQERLEVWEEIFKANDL